MRFSPVCLVALCIAPWLWSSGRAETSSKPNIIFILADDLGLDGVSCYGSDSRKTPNIDRLAASGMRFETCYSAPLCGPSRCALLTGRYAFRTGGITNQSWRADGPGAKSVDEHPFPKLMKQGGYTTGMAGKWRQVGEMPSDWGFDEYTTDPTAGGWYWQTNHLQNGKEVKVADGTYAGDVIQDFTLDFIRRHQDQPFVFYYSMHLVHGPILRTPDSPKDAKDGEDSYDDNIAYMDKQVGQLVEELKKLRLSDKTLVLFSGDNGTALTFPSTIGGRMINGKKSSMLEGGSRVPLIASWPNVVKAGSVSKDIINFTDMHATFLELAGLKPPANFPFDSRSFAPQLKGEKGNPRDWAFVQLGANWFVREAAWKMNQSGELYGMSDAPFDEKLVSTDGDTEVSKAARARLTKVLQDLNPPAGKTDVGGKAKANAKKGGNRAIRATAL